MKKIGNNLVASLGKEKFSKKLLDDKEYEAIEKKVLLYNKRPTEASKAAITKLLAPEATKVAKQKEDKKAVARGIKKQIKKVAKTKKANKEDTKGEMDLLKTLDSKVASSEVTVDQLQEIINKYKKVEEKAPEPQNTPKPRYGEGYRN